MQDMLIRYIQNGNNDFKRALAISKLSIKYLGSGNRKIAGVIADFIKDDFIDDGLR